MERVRIDGVFARRMRIGCIAAIVVVALPSRAETLTGSTILEGTWTLEYALPAGKGWHASPAPRAALEQVTTAIVRVGGTAAPAGALDIADFSQALYAVGVSRSPSRPKSSIESPEEFVKHVVRMDLETQRDAAATGRTLSAKRGVPATVRIGSADWACSDQRYVERESDVFSIHCQMPFADQIVIHAYVAFPPGLRAGSRPHETARESLIQVASSIQLRKAP